MTSSRSTQRGWADQSGGCRPCPRGWPRRSSGACGGERTAGPPIDLTGLTDFEQAVLRKTMEIPYGEVRPYSWVAREIDRPRAVRAVGTALAHNPVTFVIPCHRVVRADGHIGEYGAGGPEAKREVLGREGVDAAELERARRSRHPLHRQRQHQDLLLPLVSPRPTNDDSARGGLQDRPGRGAAGYRPCRSAGPSRQPRSPPSVGPSASTPSSERPTRARRRSRCGPAARQA